MIDIKNPDFDTIKSSFIQYLRNQSAFKDYNFEGSNMNVVLDLLSQMTYYNSFYSAMVAREGFITTAQTREGIIKTAKNLGYTPSSRKSAVAYVRISSSESGQIDKNTEIIAKGTSKDFTFVTLEDYELKPVSFDSNGNVTTWKTDIIPIYQGKLFTYSFVVSENTQQIFELPFSNLDTSSLKVYVATSISDSTGLDVEWKPYTISTINDRIYFLEELENGNWGLSFGDDTIGQSLVMGNIVVCEFMITDGELGNGIGEINEVISSFILSGYSVETITSSSSGSEKQSLESIRKLAPKFFASNDRAVTKNDYETILKTLYPEIQTIRCWGGEENSPPEYGKVFIVVKMNDLNTLSSEEKESIVKNLTQNKNVLGMSVEILDPDILYLNVAVDVQYNPTKTKRSGTQLSNAIVSQIKTFANNNFIEFDDDFYYNDLISEILQIDSAIKSCDLSVLMEKKIMVSLSKPNSVEIYFDNKLFHPYDGYGESIVSSSQFVYVDNAGSSKLCSLKDDGSGNVYIYYLNGTKEIKLKNIGTVSYETGKITLDKFTPTMYYNGEGNIRVLVKPNSNNILTTNKTLIVLNQDYPNEIKVTLKDTIK
jgi:hypothetical protein